ncbi:MAG: helix-turn-helix domain-containing protein [Rhodothalassiaceae bacterium]
MNDGGQAGLSRAVEQQLDRYFQLHEDALPPAGLYDRVMREVETPLLRLTLRATRGNQSLAAQTLGINRNTLRRKLQALGLDGTDWKADR